MESPKPIPPTFKALSLLLFLFLTISYAASATRILEEQQPEAPTVANSAPASTPVDETIPDEAIPATPSAAAATQAIGVTVPVVAPAGAPNSGGGATASALMTNPDPQHTLSFFMHDILGSSNPSGLAVAGIVTNPAVNSPVPFAKPNGSVLPVTKGVTINNGNSAVINNNNNLPFLTGLSGATNTVVQNNRKNGINGGQLPSGTGTQKLMFGTMTVIDDELSEGHELGSGLVGKAQGFYVSSSVDGSSQTMVFTAMFESGGYVDSLSFFGVRRTGVLESQLAIMGGTGKYVNAKGFATVKMLPSANDQHDTDGLETLLQFTVYLA